jgi:hypothetical protein
MGIPNAIIVEPYGARLHRKYVNGKMIPCFDGMLRLEGNEAFVDWKEIEALLAWKVEVKTAIPDFADEPGRNAATLTLSECFNSVDSASGCQRLKTYLESQPYPRHEVHQDILSLLIRIEALFGVLGSK